jgi:hypothetical protein
MVSKEPSYHAYALCRVTATPTLDGHKMRSFCGYAGVVGGHPNIRSRDPAAGYGFLYFRVQVAPLVVRDSIRGVVRGVTSVSQTHELTVIGHVAGDEGQQNLG